MKFQHEVQYLVLTKCTIMFKKNRQKNTSHTLTRPHSALNIFTMHTALSFMINLTSWAIDGRGMYSLNNCVKH